MQDIEYAEQIFKLNGPILKASNIRSKLNNREINSLISNGFVTKLKTGYYAWSSDMHNINDLQIAVTVIKNSVLCLTTAARYYDLTTINPPYIEVAIPLRGKKPVLPEYPPIRLRGFSPNIFDIGTTKVEIEESQTMVPMYDKERTVCDFFRLRQQLRRDVALEVLKNYMSRRDKNISKLLEYAYQLKIKSAIQPYVEALLL